VRDWVVAADGVPNERVAVEQILGILIVAIHASLARGSCRAGVNGARWHGQGRS